MAIGVWDPIHGYQPPPTYQAGPQGQTVPYDPNLYRPPTYTAGPTGRTVPYDPSLYTHPAAAGAAAYHTYVPAKGGWSLPTGTHLGYTAGKGYYAAPGAAAAPKAPGSQPGSLMDLYRQALAGIETPAQAEARVNREIDAQMAAQQKMLDDAAARQRADALAAMQAQSQAGAAAAAMSKGLIGAVGGEYNNAAQEISGLAGGLTGSFNKATSGEIKAANAALGNLGAPGVQVGGVGGIGGGLQAGVENYRGGTIPSQLFTEEGGAATFGLAGQTAAQNLKMTQEASAAYQSTIHDINSNETSAIQALAAGRPALAHQYLQDANDARIKAITLASGLLTAQNALTGTGAKPLTRMVGNTLMQYNSRTGQWVPVAAAPAKPKTFKGADGRTYNLLPNGTAKLIPGQGPPKKPTPKNLVYKTLVGPDGKLHLYGVDGTTGARKVDLGVTGAKPAGTAKGPSATTVAKAADLIKGWFYGNKTVQPAKGTKGQPRLTPAYKSPNFDPNNPATWGKSFTAYPSALAQLTRMGFKRDAARNMLNEYYARGDRGRPIFSTEEQLLLRAKFGRTPYERMVVTIRQALNQGRNDQADQLIAMMLQGQAFQSAKAALANFP